MAFGNSKSILARHLRIILTCDSAMLVSVIAGTAHEKKLFISLIQLLR